MPKDVLGYHVGAPRKLTYYADMLKYYRALAAATPRVKVETIGKSDEGRELVVVWVSSEANIKNLQQNRDNLARLADPRGVPEATIKQLIATTKPHYHLMGGLHSSETGPSGDADGARVPAGGRDVAVHLADSRQRVRLGHAGGRRGRARSQRRQFYCTQDLPPAADEPSADARLRATTLAATPDKPRHWRGGATAGRGAATGQPAAAAPATEGAPTGQATQGGGGGFGGGQRSCALPYWGKYVYHDNNRDINLSQISMRALADWYYTAHPPIMHDLHESLSLLYTYSGGAPQNPNLDPILFAELPFFSNWEMAQMTKWGMPGVYTHAFMDGWSPGYLGSVAYNHNGMMRMYETQSGRDGGPGAGGARRRWRWPRQAAVPLAADAAPDGGAAARGGGGRGGDGAGGGAGWRAGAAAVREPAAAAPAARGQRLPPMRRRAARRGARRRAGGPRRARCRQAAAADRIASGIAAFRCRPNAAQNFTRRNNTNYMQTGVLSGAAAHGDVPEPRPRELLHEDEELDRAGHERTAPFGYVIPAQRDMTQAGRARAHPARAGHRGRTDDRGVQDRRRDASAPARTSSRAASRTGGSRRTCSRSRTIPIRRSAPTTTAAGRWATRSTST